MKKTALAAALSVLASHSAMSAAYQSEEVVISASRLEEEAAFATKSISVETADQLRRTSQDNLPSMLEDEASVTLVSDGTPGVKRISLRSESSSRTLLLVDGQRLDDAKTKSGAPFLVNPYFIDRVEILRGPSSVLYGSDALGGIVQVITKDYSDKPFSFELGGAYNGAFSGFSEFLNASGTVGDFHYKAGVFGSDMGDLYLADHERLDNTSYRQKGLNLGAAYDFSDKFTIEAVHEYFNLDANTASDSTDPNYASFTAHIPKWQREKTSLNLYFNDLSETVAKANLSLYYQKNDKEFNSRVSEQGPYVYANNYQDTYGALGQIDLSLSEMFYLICGFELREDQLESDSGASFDDPKRQVNIYDRDLKQDTYALYTLLRSYLTDNLTVETGLRYTLVKTDAGSSRMQMGSDVFSDLNQNAADADDEFLVGSLGLNYALNDENTIRASYSQGYRAPNLQELYLTTFTGEMQQGNPNLKEETSHSFEAGFNHQSELFDFDANFFYTIADDYIDTYLTGHYGKMDVYTYRNISKATSYGLEVSGSVTIGSITPYLNATVMKRRYDTGTEQSYDTQTPLLSGRFGLRFDDFIADNPWYADLFTRFATSCDNDNLDGSSYFDDSHFAGYMTLNLALGADFFNESLKVWGSFENILDKDYRTSELISEPGRFFTLGFSFSY